MLTNPFWLGFVHGLTGKADWAYLDRQAPLDQMRYGNGFIEAMGRQRELDLQKRVVNPGHRPNLMVIK